MYYFINGEATLPNKTRKKPPCTSSCLHHASIVSKHFLLFQLMHTIIKS